MGQPRRHAGDGVGPGESESPLHIRPFRNKDLGPVKTLWETCDLIVSHNDPATDIAFCKASPGSELFIGETAGQVVATIMTGHDGHRGWISYLAMDPAHGGKGLGRQMVRHAEGWLKARGVPKVNLMIREHNKAVRKFYEAIGYACEPRLVMARVLK